MGSPMVAVVAALFSFTALVIAAHHPAACALSDGVCPSRDVEDDHSSLLQLAQHSAPRQPPAVSDAAKVIARHDTSVDAVLKSAAKVVELIHPFTAEAEEAEAVVDAIENHRPVDLNTAVDVLNAASEELTPSMAVGDGVLLTAGITAAITGSRSEASGCGHAGRLCFQGDMVAASRGQLQLFQALQGAVSAQRMVGVPWDRAEVRYCFAADLHPTVRHLWLMAIRQITAAVPCLRISQVRNAGNHLSGAPDDQKACEEKPAIFVQSKEGDGCYAHVGRLSSEELSFGDLQVQIVQLEVPGCEFLGHVIHELGHALGMGHEQSRPDRSKYVTIHWENVKPDELVNFEEDSRSFTGGRYDYLSIMHYEKDAFSVNGRDTVTTGDATFDRMLGQRTTLSQHDADQLASLYKCRSKQIDSRVGCVDNVPVCASLPPIACPLRKENKVNCCKCGGGTKHECWEGQPCRH